MRPSGLALMLALILATARPSLASLPPQTQEVIARYLAELNRVESVRGRTSIEPLFALTDTLQEYLFYGELLENRNWSQKEHPPTMEDLSESEYAELSKQLRGILLNRDEVVIAEPDSSTFLPLARRKGLKPVSFAAVPILKRVSFMVPSRLRGFSVADAGVCHKCTRSV